MNIEFHFEAEDVCVLRLKGRFLTGRDAAYLHEKTEEFKGFGRRIAVADLSDVPYLDSTGIGFLVSLYTSMTRGGGKFALASVNGRSREVLEITLLTRILPLYSDVAAAIAALRK
ncbi:MAG: STAS domain-containing protein [Acidobacteria bacterium]|nr:STAS domain-containing protein [Acidobacteriota bacterium]